MDIIKFLPSYVGSKTFWINRLAEIKDKNIIEPFCGSCVISANLAKTAWLNDADPMVYKILSNFTSLEVPEVFTSDDYEIKKWDKDNWWRYIYCLQKMSYSGVFRYSKNGYNVPIKECWRGKQISIKYLYQKAVDRYNELNPTISNLNYVDFLHQFEDFSDKVVVFDPPYEGSKANYNLKSNFNYNDYWQLVKKISQTALATIIFDRAYNLDQQGYAINETRKMRVNGSQAGDVEAMAIIKNF